MKSLEQLTVRIFADGANKKDMLDVYRHPLVKGFTTNPSLMRKAEIANYEGFAKEFWPLYLTAQFHSRFLPTTLSRWSGRHAASHHGGNRSR